MVFATSSYVKAYEDDDLWYPDASKTTLATNNLTMYKTANGCAYGEVALVNPPDLSDYFFSYSCSNDNLDLSCSLDARKKVIDLCAWGEGSAEVTFNLNYTELKMQIKVIKIAINKTSLLIVKKKKSKLKIKNYSGIVNWKVTKKNIVKISKDGTIKGKKNGNTLVYTKIGGCYLGCAVSVISKKMNTVIKKAYSLKKGKYSQPKRMLKGYYDCSSLVWRAYKKGKVYLVNKFYAPVAADLARHFVRKKKRIKGGYSYSNIAKMVLRPGDLFFCEGAKNRRYRGIYHVEMFTGYRCLEINSDGQATIVARWATVPDDYYSKDKCLMVRPIK